MAHVGERKLLRTKRSICLTDDPNALSSGITDFGDRSKSKHCRDGRIGRDGCRGSKSFRGDSDSLPNRLWRLQDAKT
jgi:hypothetical protein